MTKTQRKIGKSGLGHLDIGYWELYGAGDLEFEISKDEIDSAEI
jgi:hypothetical protein